jgi:hypothetical protein
MQFLLEMAWRQYALVRISANISSGRVADDRGIFLSVAFASSKLSFAQHWLECPHWVGLRQSLAGNAWRFPV